jgi:hypothetical protein
MFTPPTSKPTQNTTFLKLTFHLTNYSNHSSAKQRLQEVLLACDVPKEDIELYQNKAVGSPSSFKTWWITPFHMAVYDVIATENAEQNRISIELRLYKMYVWLALIAVVSGIGPSNYTIGLIVFFSGIVFTSLLVYIQWLWKKSILLAKLNSLNT